MALIGATILGAAGQVASGRLLRLSLGATWRPSSAALGAVSGVLAGPPGSMGELTLVNPTTLGVNPFVAVVQGTHATNQGQYEVPNDAYTTLAVTAQHASQFRRNLVAITVDDSQAAGVASSPTTDRARLHLIEGALSATAPAPLPTVPPNSLLLGEVAIPPAGQTVTLTPYNPRTTVRGGILPVFADALTTPGHGGEIPVHDGQYRDHPTEGLQRGKGGGWTPVSVVDAPVVRVRRNATTQVATNQFSIVPWDLEEYDTHGMFDPAAFTIFTFRRAGYYRIAFGITLGEVGPYRIAAAIDKNAAASWVGRLAHHASADGGVEATGVVPFAVGDTMKALVYHDRGSNCTVTSPSFGPTFMEAQWLRPL